MMHLEIKVNGPRSGKARLHICGRVWSWHLYIVTANVSSTLKRCMAPPPEGLDSHLVRCAFPALLPPKIVLSKFHTSIRIPGLLPISL